jgi:serine/threonine-protein kinase
MVMEHLVGEDLSTMLARRGALPAAEAVDLLLQACEAIAEAHTLGVVHRDLKPGNLFITTGSDGLPFVKVLDFGISKTVDMDSVSVTATSTVLGSPLYMSPEQLASSRDVDRRSDIWSLGVILYEMLTGTTPFHGTSFPTLCASILSGKYLDASVVRPGVPIPLNAVIVGALALDRESRIPSVEVLATRISAFGSETALQSSSRIRRIAAHNPTSLAPTRVSAAPASAFDATVPHDSSSPSLLEAAVSGSLPRGTSAGLARSSAEGATANRQRPRSTPLLGGALAVACAIGCAVWWSASPSGRPAASASPPPAALGAVAAPPAPSTPSAGETAAPSPPASPSASTSGFSPPPPPLAPSSPGPSAAPAPPPHNIAAHPASSASSHAKPGDLFGSQK